MHPAFYGAHQMEGAGISSAESQAPALLFDLVVSKLLEFRLNHAAEWGLRLLIEFLFAGRQDEKFATFHLIANTAEEVAYVPVELPQCLHLVVKLIALVSAHNVVFFFFKQKTAYEIVEGDVNRNNRRPNL